jgi:hypothetical protein
MSLKLHPGYGTRLISSIGNSGPIYPVGTFMIGDRAIAARPAKNPRIARDE